MGGATGIHTLPERPFLDGFDIVPASPFFAKDREETILLELFPLLSFIAGPSETADLLGSLVVANRESGWLTEGGGIFADKLKD